MILAFQTYPLITFGRMFFISSASSLDHDNAPSHTSLVFCDFFAKIFTPIVSLLAFVAGLVTFGFWLFDKPKISFRGHCFDTMEQIQAEEGAAGHSKRRPFHVIFLYFCLYLIIWTQ
uniref:Putative mariner mos1 transposase n=1 Tax=Anopheles darlingi TaxID=43151 RepID=A0A2M4D5M9_ANODA